MKCEFSDTLLVTGPLHVGQFLRSCKTDTRFRPDCKPSRLFLRCSAAHCMAPDIDLKPPAASSSPGDLSTIRIGPCRLRRLNKKPIHQSNLARIVKWSGLFYDLTTNGPMSERSRLYTSVLQDHLERHRQMAFISGPRQVGKTTVCRSLSNSYLNWDNADDRRSLLRGPASLAESLQLDRLRGKPPVAVLDELHKYSKWKALLKGFFDTYLRHSPISKPRRRQFTLSK